MKKTVFIFLMLILFPSCKDLGESSVVKAPFSVENSFSFDAIKLIAKEIEDGTDVNTYSQKRYLVNYDRRILMRFESLSAHEKEVDVTKPLKLVIAITGDDRASQIGYLTVCPIDRDWMMLATWKNAHPFGIEGKWAEEGGDYEYLGCMTGTLLKDYPDQKTCTLEFDVSRWFAVYPRGKQINYGLMLLSKDNIQVNGEKSYFPPRISFSEWHK